jgi:hypothetical protein
MISAGSTTRSVGRVTRLADLLWTRKQRERFGPDAATSRLAQGARDLSGLVKVSPAACHQDMEEERAELRAELGEAPATSS